MGGLCKDILSTKYMMDNKHKVKVMVKRQTQEIQPTALMGAPRTKIEELALAPGRSIHDPQVKSDRHQATAGG